ncbi:MAG: PilW family protein [Candidatus Acidiferrales bacterium]
MNTCVMNVPMRQKNAPRSPKAKGFTLIELLVAMVVFVIVAGTAFSLFGKNEAYAVHQEGLSGVNIGLRNAMSQLQMDLSGSGENLLANAPGAVQSFSLGVIVQNNVPTAQGGVGANCTPNTSTWAYPVESACYDGIMIVNPKLCSAAGGTYAPVLALQTGLLLNTASSLSATDNALGANLANDASCFKNGDEILVYEQNTQSPPTCFTGGQQSDYCMTVVTLNADAAAGPTSISLSYDPPGVNGVPSGCPGSSCNDPLGIIYQAYGAGGNNYGNALNSNFPAGAYLVNLGTGANDISYSVQDNPADPTDPQLLRCTSVLALCTAATGQELTDQVIGFKVGAALWDNQDQEDIASYFYNAAAYCNGSIPVSAPTDCSVSPPPANDANDYALVRSIRISMIARTKPETDQTLYNFKNGFDDGPYLVQQASVAIDIRNMSIGDFGN